MKEDRLSQTVEFCKLIDREKFVQRRTYLSDGDRLENDAEHAWHMAVMALLLSEYANEKVDVLKVVSLLLVHDLVEIYAGDTFAYDEEGKKTQRERESAAAERLYSQLPEDLAGKMRSLWDEFEEWGSAESRFAHTLTTSSRSCCSTPAVAGPGGKEDGVSPRCWRETPARPKAPARSGSSHGRTSSSRRSIKATS